MLRRIYPIMVILLLYTSLFCVVGLASPNVLISPDHFDFSGNKGDIITKISSLTNQETTAVHFNITCNMSDVTIVPDEITLNPSSSINFAMAYTLPVNVSSGSITFAWNGSDLRVILTYIEAQHEYQQAPVEIFPALPISGSDIVIFFTDATPGLTAKGFLSVNGYIYSVDIDGYSIISLDKNAYGTATLYLFGNSIVSTDSRKIFTIQKQVSKIVSITVSRETTIGSDVIATVTYGGDALTNQEVILTDPDDNEKTLTSDNMGKLDFSVDKIGKWKLRTTAEGQLATANFNVKYGTLLIGLVEEDYRFGDTVTVVTDPDATIDVYIDNNYETELTASSDGFASLILSRGGSYRLTGSFENLRGEYSFSIPKQAQIEVIDPLTQLPAGTIEVNKRYTVEVVGSDGHTLKDAESVWISNPTGTKELLPLFDGTGTWNPLSLGPYTLTFDDTATSAGNTKYILIKQGNNEFTPYIIAIVIVLFFIILFIMLFFYARSKALPLTYFLTSLFKRKRKIELPVE